MMVAAEISTCGKIPYVSTFAMFAAEELNKLEIQFVIQILM